MDNSFTDRNWQSADGLTLHFREYGEAGDRSPVICLHGLTRNLRDFDALAPFIAEKGWRVLVPSMRGRGESAYSDDPETYALPTYVADLLALLEQEKIERFVSIGTSMGGLMTMLLAQFQPGTLAGALLNDVGPEIETSGLDAIKSYVGQGRSYPTWMHAARSLQEVHGASYPGYGIEDWIAMAKRTLVLCNNGRISFDYDMKIAEPILAADDAAAPPDLWPAFDALADKPLALLRGELSQLLSRECFAEMQQRAPGAIAATVPNVGHAPTLDETEAREAVDSLLAQIA